MAEIKPKPQCCGLFRLPARRRIGVGRPRALLAATAISMAKQLEKQKWINGRTNKLETRTSSIGQEAPGRKQTRFRMGSIGWSRRAEICHVGTHGLMDVVLPIFPYFALTDGCCRVFFFTEGFIPEQDLIFRRFPIFKGTMRLLQRLMVFHVVLRHTRA